MRYQKAIFLQLWLFLAFVSSLDLCSAQIRFVIKQPKADIIIGNGMKLALEKINVVEEPPKSNSGKEVEIFLRSIGLKKGNPWCAAFCQWAYLTASQKIRTRLNIIRSGHSMSLFRYASINSIRSLHNPVYGDWVIFQKGESSYGHTALLISYTGDSIHTLEGNTSNCQKNNDGVFLKTHPVKRFGWMRIKGYIGLEE